MDRLRFSKEIVNKINAREEIRERISQNVYDAMAAGMTQQQVEAVMSQNKAKSDAEVAVAISDFQGFGKSNSSCLYGNRNFHRNAKKWLLTIGNKPGSQCL